MTKVKERLGVHKAIVEYLEHSCCFRDYRILPAKYFHKIHKSGIHTLIENDDDMQWQIDDSISTFVRDGFGTIYFYI